MVIKHRSWYGQSCKISAKKRGRKNCNIMMRSTHTVLALLAGWNSGAQTVAVKCSWHPAAVPSERLDHGPLNHTSEGVTTDGGNRIFWNGVSNLWVSDQHLNVSQHRGNAIPDAFRALGYRHIGDSAYYSGYGLKSNPGEKKFLLRRYAYIN